MIGVGACRLAALAAAALAFVACGDDDGAPRADADAQSLDAAVDAPAPSSDSGADVSAPDADAGGREPLRFHCAFDDTCPEIAVEGDPHATLGAMPAPFRGYGDPSLELDPDTGTLWLAYSWLDVLVSSVGPPPVVDLGVRTHLARSDDGGRSFVFERATNETTRREHPDRAETFGWMIHEVSTLVREPGGTGWQLAWLSYFEPFGTPERGEFFFERVRATSPAQLGDATPEPWIRGSSTSSSFGASHDLSAELPELADCAAFTEPAYYADPTGGPVWLAAGCVVLEAGVRRPERERLVLLALDATVDGSLRFAGTLLDGADAARVSADRLEQADLARARDGALLLLVTPIVDGADPMHQGCIVYALDDLALGHVERDADGAAIPRAVLSADGNGLGPGLCTYDAASETGVMLVITRIDLVSRPPDLLFSLRATGVHP